MTAVERSRNTMKTKLKQMKKLSVIIGSILLLILFLDPTKSNAQTVVQLTVTSAKPNINTGQDYSPWLNNNINDVVQPVWGPGTQVWVDVTLKLSEHSIIKRLSFYDTEDSWPNQPDTIFALNGTKLTMIGTFTGTQYDVWHGFSVIPPTQADAIVIRKFGNNNPAKVRIFGYSDVSTAADANLSAITLSTGTLSPAYNPLTQTYTATVPNNVTSITTTPTVEQTGATVTVNGKAVASGTASQAIPLVVGANTITYSVTSTDKTVVRPYTVVVTRGASTNALLTGLSISKGTLTPVFSSSVLKYTATVANSVTYVTFTPIAADPTAVIKVNGIIVASGKASAIVALAPGANVIKTVVTAQDNATVKTYTTTVTRTPLTDAVLSSIVLGGASSLTPTFKSNIYSYTALASTTGPTITVTPTSIDGGTITVGGVAVASGKSTAPITLKIGLNVLKVVVTAEDGKTKNTYVLNITRPQTENADLIRLGLNKGAITPGFRPAITSYTVNVSGQAVTIDITPTLSDLTSTVTVNGQSVANATPMRLVLPGDTTQINTVVTTADGTMSKTYALTVFRTTAPDTTATPPDTTTTPIDTTGTPPDTTGKVVKIPIDPSRFYMMNNVTGDLSGLFDGVTNTYINVGYGLLFNTFDCYYPVVQGEAIDLTAIKFFYHTGGLTTPMLVSVIDNTGARTQIGSYSGGGTAYDTWVGPYPGKTGFNLTKMVKNIRYIVLTATTTFGFPTEMEFDGYYTAPPDTTPVPKKYYPLSQYFGSNAFEWNFEDPNNPLVVSTTMLSAMKSFTQVRHYMDWSKLETTQGAYTYDPVHSGGWNYDALYKACQTNNMLVLADLKTQPAWMMATWPANQQDSENVPVLYGKDFNDPNSYLEQAKVAFQYAARYGTNSAVPLNLLSVDPTTRWTGDPANVVKRGLNIITYFECDNERDKWWKGTNAYQNCYQYAANLSAFYDGNMNTMGPGVGVKNADPNMKVVIGGLCSGDPAYIHGMVEWCRQHRGYRADGSVNLCWDVINYHFYASDGVSGGNATVGVAPELGTTAKLAQGYLKMAHQYAQDQEVWVTESGYDLNPGSPQRAPAIGSKSAQLVQGDWILRTSLMYARLGIARVFFYEAYDDDPTVSIQYSSSGLLNSNFSRRPAADYLFQTNKLFGTFQYKQTLNASPIVDNYQTSDGNNMYMLVEPTQTGKTGTYSLNLNGADSAYVYTPTAGANDMAVNKVKLTNGVLAVNVTETPTFVTPSGTSVVVILPTNEKLPTAVPSTTTSLSSITLYPNPTTRAVTVAFTNKVVGPVTIKVTDINMAQTYKTLTFTKTGDNFSNTIDLSSLPMGVSVVQVLQGDQQIVRKVIKTN